MANAEQKDQQKGIGCGVFLVLIGLGLFAERMGWIPFDTVGGLVPEAGVEPARAVKPSGF